MGLEPGREQLALVQSSGVRRDESLGHRDYVAAGDRDFAAEDGACATPTVDLHRGIRMESAIDDVVVEPDIGIPAVDELAEVRERETRHSQLGHEAFAVALRRQLD